VVERADTSRKKPPVIDRQIRLDAIPLYKTTIILDLIPLHERHGRSSLIPDRVNVAFGHWRNRAAIV
jgi:hypothetical protein